MDKLLMKCIGTSSVRNVKMIFPHDGHACCTYTFNLGTTNSRLSLLLFPHSFELILTATLEGLLLHVSSASAFAAPVEKEAHADNGDTEDESQILEDVVSLYALAETRQLIVIIAIGTVGLLILNVIASSIQEFVQVSLGNVIIVLARAARYRLESECQGL